jgi:hypothetical protein
LIASVWRIAETRSAIGMYRQFCRNGYLKNGGILLDWHASSRESGIRMQPDVADVEEVTSGTPSWRSEETAQSNQTYPGAG